MAGPPNNTPTGIYDVAKALHDAALPAVTAANGAPDRHGVVEGYSVADSPCSELWVEWVRAFPTVRFPQAQGPGDLNIRDIRQVQQYIIGIVRCIPTQDEGHAPPTSAARDAAAKVQFSDAYALLGSIICLLQEWDKNGAEVRWVDMGVVDGGGVGGSQMTVQIGFPVCPVCPDP